MPTLDNLYLIIGASGSGKNAVLDKIVEQHDSIVLQSYTTRPPRYEKETGHTFISVDDFTQLKDKIAYTFYNNNHYCATVEQCDQSDFFVIDPQGVEYFKRHYTSKRPYRIIYINSPLQDRYIRMTEIRGDGYSKAFERIENDVIEFYGMEKKADFVVENTLGTKLDDLAAKIWSYVASQECENL